MKSSSSSTSFKKTHPPQEETIAAISTPFGESGIGIVRISGPLAETIIKKLFKPKNSQSRFVSHQFCYGEILDICGGKPVDEVLVVLMKSPRTYTREDIVEIQCHGGHLILQKVLELVLREGARIALPGEFTKRAFLNGRIDLTQAEAVIDLIRAKTEASLEVAGQQARGLFYREMNDLKASLIDLLSLIEAHIDFPEEEIEVITREKMYKELQEILKKIEEWIVSYEEGKVFREGILCAIAGKTNVGKSSLMNILLKEERAIVTPVPGTTRDVIEEVLNINGIPVRLIDTAGLRNATDFVEKEGIKRAKKRVTESNLILLVIDGSQKLGQEDLEIFQEVKSKKKVVVINKNDLPVKASMEKIKSYFPKDPIVPLSAFKNRGIDELKKAIYSTLIHREIRITPEHLIVTNIRHKTILVRMKENLINSTNGLNQGISYEFIAFEIRSALEALGELAGETTTEEILNRIFDQFCIGK